MQLSILHVANQFINVGTFVIPDGIANTLSLVYASSDRTERQILWDQLLSNALENKPWMVG